MLTAAIATNTSSTSPGERDHRRRRRTPEAVSPNAAAAVRVSSVRTPALTASAGRATTTSTTSHTVASATTAPCTARMAASARTAGDTGEDVVTVATISGWRDIGVRLRLVRALLVVNPKATATTERTRDVIASALAAEVKLDVTTTAHRWHAYELARDARVDGFDVVIAFGGDGTVNEVVNGLLSMGPSGAVPALAVVPAGSTNVFARALGLPRDAVEATGEVLDALRCHRRRVIGLGRADERWFTFCAGMGLDADVVAAVERRRAAGASSTAGLYVRTALRELCSTREQHRPLLTASCADGAAVEGLRLGLVANTSPWTYLGTRPVVPTPRASFDAGLDLFGMRRMRARTLVRHVGQAMRAAGGSPRGRHQVAVHDQSSVVLRADRPTALQVDGDALGFRSEVRFTAVPRALAVAL